MQFYRFEFSFPSLRLVAIPRLESSVCPTILLIAGRRIVRFIGFLCYVKCNPRFEFGLPASFPMTITITPQVPPWMSALLFTHSWSEKWWIHVFPKGVNVKWNVNSFELGFLISKMIIISYIETNLNLLSVEVKWPSC